MNKIIIISILILSMLSLSSCSVGGSRTEMLNNSSDEKKADARLEQVIQAIKGKDKDSFKAIFSKKALSEADDMEGNIDCLFDFFQGKVDSWKKSDGPTVFESNNHGHSTKEVKSYYYVINNKQKYFFLLRDYPIDTDNPDNVGLYMLLVVKAEDEEKIYDENQKILYDGNKKLSHAGVYIPIKFELNACNPYRARTKGKIERPYQYIEEQFIKGNLFDSMTELNQEARIFIEETNSKVHRTTLRIPNEFFIEELPYLGIVKSKPFILNELKERKVSLDSYISVDSNRYSVPVDFVGKKVRFRIIFGYKLEVFSYSGEIIATHEIIDDRDKSVTFKEHYGELNNIAPKSIPEIIRQFQSTFIYGEIFYKQCIPHLKQPSYHLRAFIKLKELYDISSLNLILKYCIDNEIYKINEIKEIIKNKYLEIVTSSYNGEKILTVNDNSRDLSYYEEGQF